MAGIAHLAPALHRTAARSSCSDWRPYFGLSGSRQRAGGVPNWLELTCEHRDHCPPNSRLHAPVQNVAWGDGGVLIVVVEREVADQADGGGDVRPRVVAREAAQSPTQGVSVGRRRSRSDIAAPARPCPRRGRIARPGGTTRWGGACPWAQ